MPLSAVQEPVFKVEVDGAACRFEVLVNDVPVLVNTTGLPMRVPIPVSEWMVSGENELSVRVRPPPVRDDDGTELYEKEAFDPHESSLVVSLTVKKNKAPLTERRTITTIRFVAGLAIAPADGTETSSPAGRLDSTRDFASVDEGEGDIEISPLYAFADDETKLLVVSRDITLPVPFPRWRWLDGEPIPDDGETEAQLLGEYRTFHGLLGSGAVADVERLIQPKIDEMKAAYYLTTPDEIRDMTIVTDLMRSEDLTLRPLAETVIVEVFGGERLARLVDVHGESPLVWTNKDDVAYYFSLTYCRTADGWVLIR